MEEYSAEECSIAFIVAMNSISNYEFEEELNFSFLYYV